jgi:transcriptional regulator with XRE-family HTH domain
MASRSGANLLTVVRRILYICDMSATLIGANVKRVRELVGITRSQLARLLSVAPMTVTRWEEGQRKIPASLLTRIADVLDVRVALLIGSPRALELLAA